MTRIVWIGPGPAPEAVRLSAVGAVAEFVRVEDAVEAAKVLPSEVVLVALEAPGAADAIRVLRESDPDVQILIATDGGLPEPLAIALDAGASGVVDVAADPAFLAHRVHEAWIDYLKVSGERELLMRLRDLNEDFLRNMISLEKRNIELTEQLQGAAKLSDMSLLPESTDGVRERILVVDDEETICDLVTLALDGYEVKSVLDGKAAQDELTVATYHLVITDKNLPGCSGLEVIKAAKASNPDTDVIMMTGYASKEAAIEALNLGASGFLEKPFDLPVLVGKVEEVLGKQRERLKKRHYMQLIKRRNQAFLAQYGSIRTDIESWLQIRQKPSPRRDSA